VAVGADGSRSGVPETAAFQAESGPPVYPYLLRGVVIERADQVWSTDITYVPMPAGFMYLTAVIDWHSRYVLSWRLSNSLDADFCVAALEQALKRAGRRCSTPTRGRSTRRRRSRRGWRRRGRR
jgi:putative transposase